MLSSNAVTSASLIGRGSRIGSRIRTSRDTGRCRLAPPVNGGRRLGVISEATSNRRRIGFSPSNSSAITAHP